MTTIDQLVSAQQKLTASLVRPDHLSPENREVAPAPEEYDWELPALVALSSEEDFLAVTDDGDVVRVGGNEVNIETRHGSLEAWLKRYTDAALRRADDPEFSCIEDPEAEYD